MPIIIIALFCFISSHSASAQTQPLPFLLFGSSEINLLDDDQIIESYDEEEMEVSSTVPPRNIVFFRSESTTLDAQRVTNGTYSITLFKRGETHYSSQLIAHVDNMNFVLAHASIFDDAFRGEAVITFADETFIYHRHFIRVKKIKLRYNRSIGHYLAGEISYFNLDDTHIYDASMGPGALVQLRRNIFLELYSGVSISPGVEMGPLQPAVRGGRRRWAGHAAIEFRF